MKILKFIAIILNLSQVAFVVYFLARYTTDNFPVFLFLFIVSAVNLFVLVFKK